MNTIKFSRALLAAAGLAVITGCGGGGESDTTATRETGARAASLATAAQAEQIEAGLGGDVITTRVDSGADRAGAVTLAVLIAYGMQAAHNLDNGAPVLVRGDDPTLVAAVAQRMQELGYLQVVQVTP